jgi:transposase InsO family protein
MGLEAIYPKPRLSANDPDHKVYPYLLKGVTVDRPDQAWATDITYVRLAHGFVYLIAILDWSSRYVVSWELSTTLDTGFCLEALRRALRTTNIIERLNKEFKRRTKSIEIVAGENACYRLLAFISLKMEVHWKRYPIGKVAYNLPIFKRVSLLDFTQNA